MSELNLRIMNLIREISLIEIEIAKSKKHRDGLKYLGCKRWWSVKIVDLEKKKGEKLDNLELLLQRRRLLQFEASSVSWRDIEHRVSMNH